MTNELIQQFAAKARICMCQALIEEIDSGDGYKCWAHVKRGRINFDHAAVPAVLLFTLDELKMIHTALVDAEEDYGDTDGTIVADRINAEIQYREADGDWSAGL